VLENYIISANDHKIFFISLPERAATAELAKYLIISRITILKKKVNPKPNVEVSQ